MVPWLVGMSFKRQYFDFIAAINQKNQVKVVILNYKQGWLSSTASIQITPIISDSSSMLKRTPMLDPTQLAAMTTVTLDQTISHGPIVMDKINNHPTLAMGAVESILHSPEIERLLYSNVKIQGLLTMQSLFDFNKEGFNLITLPAFQYTAQGMGSVSWQGLTANVVFHLTSHSEVDKIDTNLKFGAVSIKGDPSMWQGDFSLQPITIRSATTKQALGLWIGSSEVNVPGAVLNEASAPVFNLNNLLFKNKATLSQTNQYQFSNTVNLTQLTVPSWSINSISGLTININFAGLNANELVNLVRFVNSMPNNISSDEFENQSLQALVRVITPSTNINVIALADTSLGKLNMKGLLFWPASVPAPKTPDDLFANTNAKVDIRMSIPLAKKIIDIAASNMAERSARPIAVTTPPTAPTLTTEINSPTSDAAKTAFSQKVADLLRSGKISLSVSLQILGWWDQQLPVDVFAGNLKRFGLAADTENDLIQTYTQLKQSGPVPVSPLPAQVVAASPQAQQQMQAQMQQMLVGNISQTIDQWLTQGYITQDGNDYVIAITREAGVIKVNGKDLPADMPGATLGAVPAVAH